MAISNTVLSTITGAVYTSSNDSATTALYLCNVSGSTVTFNLYAVPNGESQGDQHTLYSFVSLEPNDTYVIDTEKLIMSNGDTIQGNCSANTAVTVTVSYIGI